MDNDTKKKIESWFLDARSTYNFIHFDDSIKAIETENNKDDTITLVLKKVA